MGYYCYKSQKITNSIPYGNLCSINLMIFEKNYYLVKMPGWLCEGVYPGTGGGT